MTVGRASRETGCCLNGVSVRGFAGTGFCILYWCVLLCSSDGAGYCARRYCLFFLVIAGFLGVSGSGLKWCIVSRPVLGVPRDTPLHQ
eukprot:8929482-Pyramimonas_sp.AAC.1